MPAAFDSPLKWVPGGRKHQEGRLWYADYWAFVLSSTIEDQTTVKKLAIIATDTAEIVETSRIWAGTVRCIRDE